jgi:hypothetical protein
MSPRSTLDPEAIPGPGSLRPPGHDAASLGPSDLSDTGSDSVWPSGYDTAGVSDTGLGRGLDQAEEARYAVTDEGLDPVDEAGAPPDGVAGRAAAARSHRRREDDSDVEGAREPDEGPDDAMLDEAGGIDDARDADRGDGVGDDADEPDAR